ncbi:HAT dimerization domain-containing protein isoform 2 [Cinnamomum micranthum f. kanehirae]|uniref:HAT dimerization domain-containing protein isoform 2 n=1 Tax=Cinnamomum micranthum f. kanehirae TaxID=337451 RepID=A0A3S3PPM1_9MAGN|nr:HAT dimerization domain-containing protein isoform 2 [Cinnamomum micranthum f. kanehirae]
MVEEMTPVRSTGFVDPGWEHGAAQDDRKKKVKCNYCGKVVSGGIYRLKQHLARVSSEVTYCNNAPEDVCLKMKENLEGFRASKKQRSEDEEHQSLELHSNDDYYEEEEPPGYKDKGKQVIGDNNLVISLAPLRSLGYVDPGWEHGVPQDERKKKVKCNYCEKVVSGGINRFKQHLARIPGEVAYCKKAPEEVYLKIKENMKWHRTGRRGRRPEGKEIAAFYMHSENDDDDKEEELMNGRSKEKLAIDDKSLITSSGKAIKKRLRGRSPGSGTSGFEAPLKRSKIDSVFAMIPKSQTPSSYKQVKLKAGADKKTRREVISAICKFFYHAAVPFTVAGSPYFQKMLDLVGQYGQGLKGPSSRLISGRYLQEEIATIKEYQMEFKASWATTGCTIMADSWKDVQGRALINFLVSCPRGVYFVFSADASDIIEDAPNLFKLLDKVVEEVGEENVVQVITENTKMQYVRKSVDPIVQVLQKVDTAEGLPMPSIYHDMYRAKFAIKAIHGDDERKYGPFWCVIDNHWNSLFHHPLYMAAYFLNPSYRYRSDFISHPEVIRGLNECIVRLEPDNGRRISASMQISEFVSAKADFGTELAMSTRTGLHPASWWQQHGINCLELQRIATRILSQTCSSFGCEHNWSTFDQIHSRRRNRLSQKRLNDLIYVHYNLRLRERQLRGKPDDSISLDSVLSESLLDDWVVETEKPAFQEDEEIFYNEMEQEADENEMNGNEELEAIARKDPILATALAEVVEPLGVHPVTMVAATDDDDDDDLDFLDDELSD